MFPPKRSFSRFGSVFLSWLLADSSALLFSEWIHPPLPPERAKDRIVLEIREEHKKILLENLKNHGFSPRRFHEVKVPRFHDNGTGWW
jgi:hypothetical protein